MVFPRNILDVDRRARPLHGGGSSGGADGGA